MVGVRHSTPGGSRGWPRMGREGVGGMIPPGLFIRKREQILNTHRVASVTRACRDATRFQFVDRRASAERGALHPSTY